MATASGQVTNAVFGFTSMLINLLRDHRPDRIVVSFDLPTPTFRHERLPDYKAGRKETPDILRQQMGLVRQVIETLAIPIVEIEGFEADDVLATLASAARDAGDDVIVVTGDRDVYQLVEDPHVKVLYNKRGVSDYAFYDEAGIVERTGVKPVDYVTYAALRGDTSDNLPGVAGVGEKTAAKLVNAYGSIDGIYAHLDDQTPKLRENLAAAEDQVRSNAEVMVLVRDVPLPQGLDDLTMGDIDVEAVRNLFDFLEFRTLYDRLAEVLDRPLDGAGAGVEVLEAERRDIETAADAVALFDELASGESLLALAPGWHGDDERAALEGIAFVTDPAAAEVAWVRAELLDDPEVFGALEALVAGGRPLVGHGIKALVRWLFARDSPSPTSPSTPAWPPICSTLPRTVTCSVSCWAGTPTASCPSTAHPPQASSISTATPRRRPSMPHGRRSPCTSWPNRCSRRSTRRGCGVSTTRSRCRWCSSWPRWSTSAWASTSPGCRPYATTSRTRPSACVRWSSPTRVATSTSTPPSSCVRCSSTSWA